MRFSLYTAVVAAFAIAGSQAIRLEADECFDMMSEVESFEEPKVVKEEAAKPEAPKPDSTSPGTLEKTPAASKEQEDKERLNAAATVDSIRRGVLALRETKVEAETATKDFVEKMKAIEASKKKAACAAKAQAVQQA